MLKLIYTFDQVFAVNSRCYVRKLVPLCTFLKFHTHLEVKSARLFQNAFSKCSRVLNVVFSKNGIFRNIAIFWVMYHLIIKAIAAKMHKTWIDCKTVFVGRFRKARSAISVILECEAREPHTPAGRVCLSPFSLAVFTLAPDLLFEYGCTFAYRRSCSQKNTIVLQSKTWT